MTITALNNETPIKISASDIYSFLRPSPCDLRIYLKCHGVQEAPASPYEEILKKLGQIHEIRHLQKFSEFRDLSKGSFEERRDLTDQALKEKCAVIYQGVFEAQETFGQMNYQILGIPDFLIKEGEGYVIRDSKMSRKITEKDHPEILRSLELYGWLFEKTTGMTPVRLEVHSGTDDIIPLDKKADYSELFRLFNEIGSCKISPIAPYSPIGWSKCNGCGFFDYCWSKAKDQNCIDLVYGVDQGLCRALNEIGIVSIPDFLQKFNTESLAEFQRPYGKRLQKVGKKAEEIFQNANSLLKKQEILLKKPELPTGSNFVMFDLEGLPPQLDELDKIYLWGVRVYGENPGPFKPAVAGFGESGDQGGWEQFLHNAKDIFENYGDIPFIHWHHYEKTNLKKYIERYGDPAGIGERVLINLSDLLPITQESIVLPVYSYSLKEVEKHVGFQRTQEEYGGSWAMAKYIEATEMENEKDREEVMDKILLYNEEDLAATWAVFQWLRSK